MKLVADGKLKYTVTRVAALIDIIDIGYSPVVTSFDDEIFILIGHSDRDGYINAFSTGSMIIN